MTIETLHPLRDFFAPEQLSAFYHERGHGLSGSCVYDALLQVVPHLASLQDGEPLPLRFGDALLELRRNGTEVRVEVVDAPGLGAGPVTFAFDTRETPYRDLRWVSFGDATVEAAVATVTAVSADYHLERGDRLDGGLEVLQVLKDTNGPGQLVVVAVRTSADAALPQVVVGLSQPNPDGPWIVTSRWTPIDGGEHAALPLTSAPFPFPRRASSTSGVYTVGELLLYPPSLVTRFDLLGPKQVERLQGWLATLGITWTD